MAARNDFKQRALDKAKGNQVGGGVGESKLFGGNYTRDDGDTLPGGLKWEELHVAGMLITTLPDENQRRLAFMQTDEGRVWWEKNRGKLENRESGGGGPSRGTRLPTGREATDPDEKKILEYRDRARRAESSDDNPDPAAELIAKYVPAGWSGMLMSEKVAGRQGMSRGGVRYERVTDEHGKPVMLGDMFVAMAPISEVEGSKRRALDQDKQKRKQAVDLMREKQQEVISESSLNRIVRKKGAGADFGGIEVDEPNDSEMAEMSVGGFGREFNE